MTTVSVAMGAFNGAGYLREALDSVLAQTLLPIEIVVMDDGSTDATREVCAAYGAAVTYVYQTNDGTLGAGARLNAMRRCRGDWVATLDQDDRWRPSKLEAQVQVARQAPDVAMVVTAWVDIDAQGAATGTIYPAGPIGDVYHDLLRWGRYCISSSMFRRAALVEAGLHTGELPGFDYGLWLALARDFRVAAVEEPLTERRVHAANVSADSTRFTAILLSLVEAERERLHHGCQQCRWLWRDRMLDGLTYQWGLEATRGNLGASLRLMRRLAALSPRHLLRPRLLMRTLRSVRSPRLTRPRR